MAYRVVWSSEAAADLQWIADLAPCDSPVDTKAVVRRVIESTRKLAQYPRMGRVVPEVGHEALRELLIYGYRVVYRVEDAAVTIAAVARCSLPVETDNPT